MAPPNGCAPLGYRQSSPYMRSHESEVLKHLVIQDHLALLSTLAVEMDYSSSSRSHYRIGLSRTCLRADAFEVRSSRGTETVRIPLNTLATQHHQPLTRVYENIRAILCTSSGLGEPNLITSASQFSLNRTIQPRTTCIAVVKVAVDLLRTLKRKRLKRNHG